MTLPDTADVNRLFLEYAGLGKIGLAEKMLGMGAQADARDDKGRTALHLAATFQRHEMVEYLLGKGFDHAATDNAGETPLVKAVAESTDFDASLKTTKALLGKGADVNAVNPANGTTPLMVAATYNNWKAMALLLGAKAHIDAQDNDGRTALMQAAKGGEEQAFGVLVSEGADPLLRDKQGWTAADMARAGVRESLVGILDSYTLEFNRAANDEMTRKAVAEINDGLQDDMRTLRPLAFRKTGSSSPAQ